MKWAFALSVVAIVVSGISSVHAVGPTTRITIEGAGLATPIVITDRSITNQFFLWSGSFMFDPSGPVPAPQLSAPRFKVSFYVNHRTKPPSIEELAYVLHYQYDAASGQPGLVYLPGRNEPEWALNVFSILRRVEGNWMRPTQSWEQVVNPLIARSISAL